MDIGCAWVCVCVWACSLLVKSKAFETRKTWIQVLMGPLPAGALGPLNLISKNRTVLLTYCRAIGVSRWMFAPGTQQKQLHDLSESHPLLYQEGDDGACLTGFLRLQWTSSGEALGPGPGSKLALSKQWHHVFSHLTGMRKHACQKWLLVENKKYLALLTHTEWTTDLTTSSGYSSDTR